VQVISSNNTSQVASVIVAERDGFIKLQADNFTFSSPTIKIKLEQPAATVPAPLATPAPSAKPVAKTITLICVKGKTTKKVTGVNPRCPAGYVKK
jgi:hypothetical protein